MRSRVRRYIKRTDFGSKGMKNKTMSPAHLVPEFLTATVDDMIM
jgi:hypothetical protein